MWALSAAHVYVAVREDAEIETDKSVFFTSQRVAILGSMRVGVQVLAPRTLVRLRRAAS